MKELIKDTLPLIEEEKKALAPGGFKLSTFRLRDRRSNRYPTTTALIRIRVNPKPKLPQI